MVNEIHTLTSTNQKEVHFLLEYGSRHLYTSRSELSHCSGFMFKMNRNACQHYHGITLTCIARLTYVVARSDNGLNSNHPRSNRLQPIMAILAASTVECCYGLSEVFLNTFTYTFLFSSARTFAVSC